MSDHGSKLIRATRVSDSDSSSRSDSFSGQAATGKPPIDRSTTYPFISLTVPTMTTLPILCFNDVYRVSQKYVPQPGAPDRKVSKSDSTGNDTEDKINVAQFGRLLESHREKWADRPDKEGDGKEGLVLFAGDVFNPSVESSVTRGSHMVPILNALTIDVACIGNHDFDFGKFDIKDRLRQELIVKGIHTSPNCSKAPISPGCSQISWMSKRARRPSH